MQLKTTILKYIKTSSLLLALLLGTTSFSQEIIEDTPEEEVAEVIDSLAPFKRYKAEGVSAVVGEYVILDSDIDKSYIEYKAQGISTEDITRCQLLGKLMEDKLYAHHAKIDSILVPDAEINQQIDQQLAYMVSELGSEEKVAKYYRKDDISDLRRELFDVNKTLKLASEMQRKIVEDVEVTPEEVRSFFYSIPEEDRPFFSAELEVAQIVVEPEITEEARAGVIARLNQMRADVVDNGASFSTKAVLYSKDGSAQKGGMIAGIKRNSPYAKEFKDQAFSLLEGEVSEPFETEFGYHILYVDKIRGQEVDARHIILFPEVSQETLDAAKTKIDTIRESLVAGKYTFKEAAQRYSTETETRNNGGQLVNPLTYDTRFDLTKMDPTLSAQVYNLKQGEISQVYSDRDYTGKTTFKIMTVTQRHDEHKADYVNDYEKIKALALKEKQIKAIEKWQGKKINDTYISVNEDYQDCTFSSNWLKK